MKSLQIATIGLSGSGKTVLVNKIQQKKELEDEKFNVYSFKQGDSLVYLSDTQYNLSEPKNMLTLLKEADACLLCVSATEGINPKFGELVLLLNFLDIQNGIIAITKTDSSSADEVESLKAKLKVIFADSNLKNAPMIGTSSITDEGFEEVKSALVNLPNKQRDASAKFKMPIEIAKEVKSGFTTIYGVIESGSLKKYDKTWMMPWGKEFIVQEISLHGEISETAKAGDRVGIFFKGLYPWDVQTGDTVTIEGNLEKSKKVKFEFEISKFFKDELRVGTDLFLNIGSQTQNCSISSITKQGSEAQALASGEKGEIIVESKLPFAFEKNQRCVVIHPEAHWRTIKVVGFGFIKEGME